MLQAVAGDKSERDDVRGLATFAKLIKPINKEG